MMKKLLTVVSVFFINNAIAQTISPSDYIAQYKDLAIREMKRMGIPASITLAQGILETESGNSVLVKKSNNHFGIKCKSSWTASGVTHDDDAIGECFRQYKSAEDSYRDHSNFLRGSQRYAFLFKLAADDYRGWAYGLKKAGYATNPRYPEILIKNIEQFNLNQYTLEGINDVPKFDASQYEDDKEEPLTIPDEKPVVIKEEKGQTMLDAPDGIVVINGNKAVLGKKGTSLLAIASKNNIDLAKLLSFNEMSEDGMLGKDQYIFLQKKSKKGEKDFYILQYGESFFDAAQKNGIQLQYLMDYNNLKSSDAAIAGTKLWLTEKSREIKPVLMEKATSHIVQPKEGLYSISKKYNVSLQNLRDWNKLETDDLRIGQELKVSQ